ncbi:MAG: hypothetical protein NTW49_02915 [Bacteroidia bacterium]|nr:hypothetical protein [Bacteroidia bacterium]
MVNFTNNNIVITIKNRTIEDLFNYQRSMLHLIERASRDINAGEDVSEIYFGSDILEHMFLDIDQMKAALENTKETVLNTSNNGKEKE